MIFTPWYFPHLGGVETLSDLLASEFTVMGNSVTLVTSFHSDTDEVPRSYRVVRCPPWREELAIARWADAVLMFVPSLRHVWIPLLVGTPVLIAQTTWLPFSQRPVVASMQKLVSALLGSVVPSKALAADFWGRVAVVENPYDASRFRDLNRERTRDIVYVGRLVPEKGVDTLLRALNILKEQGMRPSLSLVGSGYAEAQLRRLAEELNVMDQVQWCGPMTDMALVEKINLHRIQVVPSKWREPFGIVALEGLACGCELVISRQGGLMEAAGKFATLFDNGDPHDLAHTLRICLMGSGKRYDPAAIEKHLSQFTPRRAAVRYIELLKRGI